jgi:hypothetical protein
MGDKLGYLYRTFVVAQTLKTSFTDEELAVACVKRYGANVKTYRKRPHQLRFDPPLFEAVGKRRCDVTGKLATAYITIPDHKDKRYANPVYRLAMLLRGEYTDEEIAVEHEKKRGGNQESTRKLGSKLREWPPLLMLTDRRPCGVTKKTASVYKALPSAEVERLREMSPKERSVWKRQIEAAVLRRMNDRLDDQNRQLLADT